MHLVILRFSENHGLGFFFKLGLGVYVRQRQGKLNEIPAFHSF